ncbi:uncharacterized protein LOC135202798 [Macrobrachium nipponense]|uniref:uncharacterized protein LOC135202798 n=1 Tax=Macrobrachium nipponense TaxID=159736 RepID=UPI0030C82A28
MGMGMELIWYEYGMDMAMCMGMGMGLGMSMIQDSPRPFPQSSCRSPLLGVCNLTAWVCKQRAVDTANVSPPRGQASHQRQESLSPITTGTLKSFAAPRPVPGTPDANSMPVPLVCTEQCHAPSSKDVEPPQTSLSAPGPELVLVPNLNLITNPPMGDPPTCMELITAHCPSPVHDSSLPSPPSAEDEPLAELTITPSLDDQEFLSQESDSKFTLTTAVTTARVCLPVASGTTTASAPDVISGLSPESVPPSPPRTGVARPWRN